MVAIQQGLCVKPNGKAQRIIDPQSPTWLPTLLDATFQELLNIRRPISEPFDLCASSECRTRAFSLQCAYLIRTNTLREPERTANGNTVGKALIKENLASDSLGNCSAQLPKGNHRAGKIAEPCLSLCFGQSNTRRWSKGGARGNLAVGLTFFHNGGEKGGEGMEARPVSEETVQGLSCRIRFVL